MMLSRSTEFGGSHVCTSLWSAYTSVSSLVWAGAPAGASRTAASRTSSADRRIMGPSLGGPEGITVRELSALAPGGREPGQRGRLVIGLLTQRLHAGPESRPGGVADRLEIGRLAPDVPGLGMQPAGLGQVAPALLLGAVPAQPDAEPEMRVG